MRHLNRFHRWLTTSSKKIYVALVLFSIIPLVLFLYSADRLLRASTVRRLDQQTGEFANLVTGVFERQFGDGQNLLVSFAVRPDLVSGVKSGNMAEVTRILKQAQELAPEFAFVSVYDTAGTLHSIYPADPILGRNFRSRDWFKGVTSEWKPYVSELYTTSVRNGEQVVAIAVPVKDERGTPIGILMAPYSEKTIASWDRYLSTSSARFIEIVDRRGNPIVGRSRSNAIDREFEPVRRALAGQTGHGRFQRSSGGVALAAYKPIPSLRGGVVIAVPLTEVSAAIWQFERPLVGLGFLFFLVAIVFGSLSAGLSRRLRENEKQLEQKNQELDLRNREVERANEMKSKFLASMSHELRTPLNAILGFSQLLAEGSAGTLNDKQKKWVEHVRKSGKHLLQLINDILDLAKIEAGRVELVIESFVANGALPEVISNIRPLAMAKQIRLVLDCEPSLSIQADRLRFKQILYNLLSNAIKFTPDRGEVRIAASASDGGITFVVADTGIGIRAEDLGVIFEEFRQVGDDKEVHEGTGLGLAIVKRLLDQQGGTIRVESEVGVGTRFIFTLPKGDHAASDEAAAALEIPAGGSGRPLVLVVDDDHAARELMINYLSPEGYTTALARNGQEAVSLARELRPDVITLDILMPSGSGWEILYTLRNDPVTAAIPIIVVSVVDHKNLGMTLGAADYLVKPIDKSMLLDVVSKHLSKSAGAHCRCVAADDDPEALKLMFEVLSEAGCSVRLAGNGQEALNALRAEHADLLLLDLMMPEMDGFEVIRQMDSDRELSRVPVVVLTAKTLTNAETAALARSTRALLHKHDDWRARLLGQLRQITQQKKRSAAANEA